MLCITSCTSTYDVTQSDSDMSVLIDATPVRKKGKAKVATSSSSKEKDKKKKSTKSDKGVKTGKGKPKEELSNDEEEIKRLKVPSPLVFARLAMLRDLNDSTATRDGLRSQEAMGQGKYDR